MNPRFKLIAIILVLIVMSSCEFISNTITYRNTSEEFIEALINEDYDKCAGLFAMDHEMAKNVSIDSIRAGLPNLRNVVVKNFGGKLEYTLMSSTKKFSTIEGESTAPNTTEVSVQIENQREFGVVELLFDDVSKNILNIHTLNIKEEIPNMLPFWLFGLMAICIPIFNVFVISRIRRSTLSKKWLKYLAVFFFNVPAVSYAAVGGFDYELLSFQILLGISFLHMGFMNSLWTFGIPLGGLYWLWKLSRKKSEPESIEHRSDGLLDDLIVE